MTLKLEKAIIPNDQTEEVKIRYIITKDRIPLDEINAWLEEMSTNSPLTGQRYGYVLIDYLNYLQILRFNYWEVTRQATIKGYVKFLLGYSGEVVSTEGKKNLKTIRYHVAVVKQFYLWLQENGRIEHNPVGFGNGKNKKGKAYVKSKFLYGQIYQFDNTKSSPFYAKLKFNKQQNHIKWYTIEQIQKFIDNLPSHRDRLIFRISVECGLRISEILGLHVNDIDRFENVIQVRRKANNENEAYAKTDSRDVEILDDLPIYADELMKDIENYINGEREQADIYHSSFLFLNNKGKYKGMPSRRRNFLKTLKAVAEKIGIDASQIRTHSGRSTRIEMLTEYGASLATVSDYVGASTHTIHKYYTNKSNIKKRKETLAKVAPRRIKSPKEKPQYDNRTELN